MLDLNARLMRRPVWYGLITGACAYLGWAGALVGMGTWHGWTAPLPFAVIVTVAMVVRVVLGNRLREKEFTDASLRSSR